MIRIIKDLFINMIASSVICPRFLRILIYKTYGMKIETKKISPNCFFDTKDIFIGKHTFINYGCLFTNGSIKIGDFCAIGYETLFCAINHEFGDSFKRAGKNILQPIIVKNGCWIGARTIILPGKTIGEGCIIAAGSIITKDCLPNGLYAGIPAIRIKDLI